MSLLDLYDPVFFGGYGLMLKPPYNTAYQVSAKIQGVINMTFKQQLKRDNEVFFNTDEFAELVTYKTFSGSSTENVPVVIADKGSSLTEYGVSDTATIAVRQSDVSLPKNGDYFELGGLVYTVLNREVNDNEIWLLHCETREGRKP